MFGLIIREVGARSSHPARSLCSPCLRRIRMSREARQTRYHSISSTPTSTPTPPPSTPPSSAGAYHLNGQTYPRDSWSNAPPTILNKLDRKLLHHPSHPLSILRKIIESHFATYTSVTPHTPIVSVYQNFDELGFAADHPGRSLTDSYYLNKDYMLRTHTSAHEVETFKKGLEKWLLSSDVYRRDEIDASHYPVFHQMEGAHVWPQDELDKLPALNAELERQLKECPLVIEDTTSISASNPYQATHDPKHAEEITKHLKHSLNSLIFKLFGQSSSKSKQPGVKAEPLRVRWIEAFFPFTTPSYEVEVWWNGEWLELLGCGVVQQKTLNQAGHPTKSGWAFGLGLERIAMVLFSIPDIRLFWSEDPRFLDQFSKGEITTFQPYSKYPPCYKDMSFWLPKGSEGVVEGGAAAAGGAVPQVEADVPSRKAFHENDYCEIVREVAGDLIENVTMIDNFTHPKSGRQSKCYRLNYRSMDRSLSNDEVNALQDKVQKRVVDEMGIEMR